MVLYALESACAGDRLPVDAEPHRLVHDGGCLGGDLDVAAERPRNRSAAQQDRLRPAVWRRQGTADPGRISAAGARDGTRDASVSTALAYFGLAGYPRALRC